MNEPGQSDRPVVPAKSPNNAGRPAAEEMEGRGLAKGNPRQQTAPRAQDRVGASSALEWVRRVAERDKQVRFTTLLHHVYAVDHLRATYFALKRDVASGVDGETWEHYGQALEENLADLSGRLKRGAYRAKPVKRTYIAKTDGRLRPLGIPTLEDKLVQRTTVEVLNAIYETDFLGFSYGFRPGRSPHQALDALYAGRGDSTLEGGAGFDAYYVGRGDGRTLIVDDTVDGGNELNLYWGSGPTPDRGADPDDILFLDNGDGTWSALFADGTGAIFRPETVPILNFYDAGPDLVGGTDDDLVYRYEWNGSEYA